MGNEEHGKYKRKGYDGKYVQNWEQLFFLRRELLTIIDKYEYHTKSFQTREI